ncbi:N5-glutamine methyltransferase family protein [Actinomyces wuliandei]|uniref:N5-glutamine methyltransferase family protein n=1 Tax=Actinomyces wuliandei TaxID=2057743 RepID=UPI000FD77130|nr:peptide chain release factor N(5)-glutamine methyltransferase [Actinomyces wuliandei]
MGVLDRYALRRAVREAGERLARAGVASPAADARLLAEHLLGRPLALAEGAGEDFVERYAVLVERRATREPLQHVLGVMWFRGLELVSRRGVFIVRPETEVVAEAAIDALRGAFPGRPEPWAGAGGSRVVGGSPGAGSPWTTGGSQSGASVTPLSTVSPAAPLVVDLCTGSGAVAAAVAREVPGVRVVAVELEAAAAGLAQENCQRLVPGRVEVVHGDATDPATLARLDGTVDVVVANPPYVPAGAVEDVETRCYDPQAALYGGGVDGLAVPRAVVARARGLLREGGVLVVEHDPGQSAALRQAALGAGFRQASTGQDLTGRERYLRAVR